MVARDTRVECGNVPVRSGDYVYGDIDGVVVIPKEIVTEVIARAAEKIDGENTTRDDIRAGVPLGEVYRKYGIL